MVARGSAQTQLKLVLAVVGGAVFLMLGVVGGVVGWLSRTGPEEVEPPQVSSLKS